MIKLTHLRILASAEQKKTALWSLITHISEFGNVTQGVKYKCLDPDLILFFAVWDLQVMKYSQTGSRRSSLLRDKDVRWAELLGHTERKGRGARPHS